MLAQFQDPLIYLLLGAIVIALIAWLIEGRPGWPVDAIVIGLIVLLNGLLAVLLIVIATHRLEWPQSDRSGLLRLLTALLPGNSLTRRASPS